MAFERINPDTPHATAGYHHVTITPGRPHGAPGRAMPGGPRRHGRRGRLDAQVDHFVANALLALAAAGAAALGSPGQLLEIDLTAALP